MAEITQGRLEVPLTKAQSFLTIDSSLVSQIGNSMLNPISMIIMGGVEIASASLLRVL